jgi:hypothetical protein
MNNMFTALVCLLFAKYMRACDGETVTITTVYSALRRLCFAAGLGLSNQHTLVLLVLPLALWVLVFGARRHGWTAGTIASLFGWCVPTRCSRCRSRSALGGLDARDARDARGGCVLCRVLAGMLPYVYLPVASHFTAAGTWGDATTVSGTSQRHTPSCCPTCSCASSSSLFCS